MSYRTSLYSPRPTFGLGTMPGRSDYTTYSARRSGSASRKYESSSSYTYSSSSSRSSNITRPLPPGPGPLDVNGKKYSESRRTSTSSLRNGPLKADHNCTPTTGTLPRNYPSTSMYVGSSSVSDVGSRSLRSRSVVSDRLANDINNMKINDYNGYGIKASPRTVDSDDSIVGNRESRREKHEQSLDWRAGSRISRHSNNSVNSNDGYTIGNHVTSVNRDLENRRKESVSDVQPSKSLSRQSSSSSISTVSYSWKQRFQLLEILWMLWQMTF